jgi:hypothetical protein
LLLSAIALVGGLAWQARPEDQTLCSGYAECRTAGYGDFGYGRARQTSWWQMGTGSNCTNFVAYRLVRAGLPNRRPAADRGRDVGSLDAYRWGLVYASRTDRHPVPGAVAWWGRHSVDPWGHVAIVESVNRDGSMVISEDSATGPSFDWKLVRPGRNWPTGFIHFPLLGARNAAAPAPAGRRGTISGNLPAAPPPAHRAAGPITAWAGPADPPRRGARSTPPVRSATGSGPDPHLRPR